MDFYDAVPGDRGGLAAAGTGAAGQAPDLLLLSSSYGRSSGFLPRLCSIPEVSEQQQDERWRAALAATAGCAPPADWQRAGGSAGSAPCAALPPPPPIPQPAAGGGSSSSAASSSSGGGGGGGDAEDGDELSTACSEGSAGEELAAAADLPAVAASAWAINIRHFTDCVPISADSLCSTSVCSLKSATGAAGRGADGTKAAQQPRATPFARQQQQQQQHEWPPRRHRRRQRDAAAVATAAAAAAASGSLRTSASSGSLAAPGGTGPHAAGEAALQASLLAALQDLDDLEHCPWDRVVAWLEGHAQGEAAGEAAPRPASSTAGAEDGADAGFDAPEWWQESVVSRLQEQREALHEGSLWARARVLASLAAQKAACALQV